jgi:hypothetical protein
VAVAVAVAVADAGGGVTRSVEEAVLLLLSVSPVDISSDLHMMLLVSCFCGCASFLTYILCTVVLE